MLAFSIDYYGIFFGATQSVELFCTYKMKVQGILVATVCLLLCFTGCAVPGQTETTSSGESHSAESTASLDDADFQQESAGFAPKDQMTEPFTGS